MTDTSTKKQLELIDEMNSIFMKIHARYWLRGGWAIDFYLGHISRTHSDIDLVTWKRHRNRIKIELLKAGFKDEYISGLQTNYYKDDIEVSIIFLNRDKDGQIIANGFPDWIWISESLSLKKYKINNIVASIVNPKQLLENIKIYEKGTGRKPRNKDLETLKILYKIIEQEHEQEHGGNS